MEHLGAVMTDDKDDDPEVVKIAVGAYKMFQSAIKLLIARADTTAAQNYIEMVMVGLPAPWDRAAIHLIREHGLTPGEIAKNNKRIALHVAEALENVARNVQTIADLEAFKTELEQTLTYVREQKARLV
jgi:hypothetical protein